MQSNPFGNPVLRIIPSRKKELVVTECKWDLDVLISSDGTWDEQVNSATSKAYRVLGLMKNTFSSWKINSKIYFESDHFRA